MGDNFGVQLVISGKDDQLNKTLTQSERRIQSFGDKAVATFKRVGESVKSFSQAHVRALETIGIGVGMVAMTKDMLEYESAWRRIYRAGGLTTEQLMAMRKSVRDLIDPASKIKIPLTKGELQSLQWEMIATGLAAETINRNLVNVAKGAVAAGIANKALYGATMGELLEKYKVKEEDLIALQNQLNEVLKMPDVRKNPEALLQTLQGMAKTMQLIEATGMENVTPLLAILGQITPLMGSPEAAGASMEALMNGMLRVSKNPLMIKALKGEKIEFFESSGKIKPLEDLLPEIKKLDEAARRHGMDIDAVAMRIFGRPEAGKAIMGIAKNLDDIEEKIRSLKNSTGSLDKDFATEAGSMSAKLKQFQNQLDAFKVDHMASGLKVLSGTMDQFNQHPALAKGILGGLAIGAGVILLEKIVGAVRGLYRFGRDIGGIWTGKGGPGGMAGPSMANPMPVYVVNKYLSMPPGTYGGTAPGPVPGGAGGKVLSALGKAGAATGAGAVGYTVGSLLNEGMGWVSDKLSGGKYKGEGWLGEMLYDFLHQYDNQKMALGMPDINITLNVDQSGRLTADMGAAPGNISIRRGGF